MPAVRMFITKFGREVLIDDDHPLAIEEKGRAATEPDRKEPEEPEEVPSTAREARGRRSRDRK